MPVLGLSDGFDSSRRDQRLIELRIENIGDTPAFGTDKMMMAIQVGVEPSPVSRADLADKTVRLKKAHIAVDRIERQGRPAPFKASEHRLGVGMFIGTGQFSVNGAPLRRRLDARFFA